MTIRTAKTMKAMDVALATVMVVRMVMVVEVMARMARSAAAAVVAELERPWRGEAEGGHGRGVVGTVALLIPDLSPGGFSAPNPTVGIGALRKTPRRVSGPWLQAGNPPIHPFFERGNGLTAGKGTPRISSVTMPGGVSSVNRLLIHPVIATPVFVGPVDGHVALSDIDETSRLHRTHPSSCRSRYQ